MKRHTKFVIAGILFGAVLVVVFSLVGSRLIKADPTTPPGVQILSYIHTDFVSDRLYLDIYDNSGSGLAGVRLFTNGIYALDIPSPYDAVTYDTSALADGTYQLTAVATDLAGNVATSSPFAITIEHAPPPPPPDTDAPYLNILSVVDNKIFTDIYDIGESGIASVQLYIDGIISQTIIPPAAYDLITIDTSTLAYGEHEFFVSVFDVAGNQATSSLNLLTVTDTTAPETTDNVPDGSRTESAVVTLSCVDSVSGCQKTFYTIDGSDPDISSSFVNASNSWQFSVSSIGSYVIKYRSIDNDGNLEAVKTAPNTLVIIARTSSGGGSTYIPPVIVPEPEIVTTTVTTTPIATTTTTTIDVATTTPTTTEIIIPVITTEVVIEVPAVSVVKIKKVKKTTIVPPVVVPSAPVVETATPPVVEIIPDVEVQLFDIVLGLQNALLGKSTDLISRLEFISFGNVPTTVQLDYMIVTASGEIVYNETDEVTVETERVVTRNFGNLNLPDGKYTLVVTTVYSDQVIDEFRQDFEIRGSLLLKYKELVRISISFIILIIVALAIFWLFKFVSYKKKIIK